MKRLLLFWYKKNMEILGRHEKAWKFRPTASYLGRTKTFVLSRCKSSFVVFDGRSMTVPENEYLQNVVLTHDRLQEKLVKDVIKKGDIVLDLGANIGYWTCLFAELVGNSGKVFSFEPEPNNFKLLKKNVEMNGYKNVTLEQKAVANKTDKTLLYLTDNGTMDHRIYQPNQERESIEVEVVKLDDYFKNLDVSIDFIKSNIQGADFAAIEGMPQLFKKSKNLKMIVEFAPHMAKGFGSDPEEFIEYLSNMGFKFYEVWWYDKKLKPIPPSLLKEYSRKSINTNLLCTKEEPNIFI